MEKLSSEELAEKIAEATELMTHLGNNPEVFEGKSCRDLRRAIQPLIDAQQKKMFGGMSLKEHKSELQRKKRAESMRAIQQAEDKKLLEKTELRAERLKRLVKISDQSGLEHSLVLDGCAEDGSSINSTVLPCDMTNSHKLMIKDMDADRSCTSSESDERLNKFKSCYICKRRFSKLHHFYHSLCEICAAYNWKKRMQVCDMSGRVCLVTGGRVKIGFQCCLKLLRCGATVVCTSRFPVDAAKRFSIQNDFSDWKHRLFTIGLDLRDIVYTEFFCQQMHQSFPRLDVIINNACQTVRRPSGYYSHMIEDEVKVCKLGEFNGIYAKKNSADQMVIDEFDMKSMLSLDEKIRGQYNVEKIHLQNTGSSEKPSSIANNLDNDNELCTNNDGAKYNDRIPAEMSQFALVREDSSPDSSEVLPLNVRDVNNQQIDLRKKNSWLLKTDEVETPEVAEVFAINSISPFVLVSKLKGLLAKGKQSFEEDISSACEDGLSVRNAIQEESRLKTLNEFILASLKGDSFSVEQDSWSKSAANHRGSNLTAVCTENCSFVVNVSSMEGKFYRPKTVYHSHTNMAKAALNMLTRTASVDYQQSNIYMSAVDTGWINDENPLEKASKIAAASNFCTPLDEVDAASRILDPILAPLSNSHLHSNGGKSLCSPPFGCFLKDYFVTEW